MHEVVNKAEKKMQKSIESLSYEYDSIRAGRANPAVLEKIMVDYYDTPTPINQLAAISVSEARILVISPWDTKSLELIKRAILKSDLGINPIDDGKIIRIIFPQLTQDRRKGLSKEVYSLLEEGKISIRNVRRDAMEKLKSLKKDKTSGMSEDEIRDLENEIQDKVKIYTKKMEDIAKDKVDEIMEI